VSKRKFHIQANETLPCFTQYYSTDIGPVHTVWLSSYTEPNQQLTVALPDWAPGGQQYNWLIEDLFVKCATLYCLSRANAVRPVPSRRRSIWVFCQVLT
jgi:hypothetical protein